MGVTRNVVRSAFLQRASGARVRAYIAACALLGVLGAGVCSETCSSQSYCLNFASRDVQAMNFGLVAM